MKEDGRDAMETWNRSSTPRKRKSKYYTSASEKTRPRGKTYHAMSPGFRCKKEPAVDQGREDNTCRSTNPKRKRYSRVPPGFRSAKRLKVVSNENIATEAKMNHSKKQLIPQYDMCDDDDDSHYMITSDEDASNDPSHVRIDSGNAPV